MRMSESFGRTLRQAPAGHDPSTAYALRAALVRFIDERLAFLPIGLRVVTNISEELLQDHEAGNHIDVPGDVHFDTWRRLIDDEIQSYRPLPLRLFSHRFLHFSDHLSGLASPKWVRGLQWQYAAASEISLAELCEQWLDRCERRLGSLGLQLQRFERGEGAVGWIYLCDFGPQKLLACSSCSYMASQARARFNRSDFAQEDLRTMELVSTPGTDTIESLTVFLGIPAAKTLKAVFLRSNDGTVVLVLIRGDLEISLEKLERVLGRGSLIPATREDIAQIGAVPGYASPINLQVRAQVESEGVLVVADLSIEHGSNFTSGANKAGYHFSGVNYPRDFEVTLLADIAMPRAGDRCPECGKALEIRSGIRVGDWEARGNAFQFSDEGGNLDHGWLGTGILYIEPILAALIDVYHHEGVANWPGRLAPYDVYLVDLRSPQATNEVLEELQAKGLSVLLDDREVSPGVKFTDSDLFGCLFRITVSKRSLERGGVELVCRAGQIETIYSLATVAAEAAALKNKFM